MVNRWGNFYLGMKGWSEVRVENTPSVVIVSNIFKHQGSPIVFLFFNFCPILNTCMVHHNSPRALEKSSPMKFSTQILPFSISVNAFCPLCILNNAFLLGIFAPASSTYSSCLDAAPSSEIFLVSICFRMLSCPLLLYTWFLDLFLGLIRQQDGESFEGL